MDGFDSVLDKLASAHPDAPAAEDGHGSWTYGQLSEASLRVAAVLQARGVEGSGVPSWSSGPPEAPRPLALVLPRGRAWYALCWAGWRLGLPVCALSEDMPDKAAERDRAARAARELRPLVAVVDGDVEAIIPDLPPDCVVFQVAELWNVMTTGAGVNGYSGSVSGKSPDSVLLYSYTGGTTKYSKCCIVTHAMALWEMAHYAEVMKGSMSHHDRVLQYTSAYWGAAAFGQLDIALAFGACAIFVPTAPGVDWLATAVAQHRISVLGTVPSQLRGAYPGGPTTKPACLKVILTWGEKLTPKLSGPWREHCTIIDLLIASEYWLALHSDCSTCRDIVDGQEKHVLRPLQQLDMLLMKEDGKRASPGEAGELLISGATVSPGYLGPDNRIGSGPVNEAAYTWIDGRRYFRTKDRLRLLPGGGMIYCGRADSLAKRGGVFVDLEAIEEAVSAVPGVAAAAVLQGDETDVFLALEPPPYREPLCRILDRARRAAGGTCRLHPRSELPMHPATFKMDRRRLRAQLDGARDREAQHRAMLNKVQRKMLLGYCSVCPVSLLLLLLPGFAFLDPLAALAALPARLLYLPCVWAVILYAMPPTMEKSLWRSPLAVHELEMLAVGVLPASCLGPAMALTCALLLWLRERAIASSGCSPLLRSLSLVAVVAALAAAVVVNGYDQPWPSASVLVAGGMAAAVAPAGARSFFAGLPVTYCIVLPKLLSDEWTWRVRCDEARLRRLLQRWLVPFYRPDWDASWAWDDSRTNAYWAGPGTEKVVQLRSACRGIALQVSLANELQPAMQPPKAQNGSSAAANGNGGAMGAVSGALSVLVERAGGNPQDLGMLDSLQAITLAEFIRKEMGLAISVADILHCGDAEQLALKLASNRQASNGHSPETPMTPGRTGAVLARAKARQSPEGLPDAQGAYKVFLMDFPRMPVDWLVRYGGPGHLDVPALQRAADRLVARHSALRTVQTPDDRARPTMDKAAAVWQIWASALGRSGSTWRELTRFVGGALYACWPRTILRSAAAARLDIKFHNRSKMREEKWDNATDDEYIHSSTKELIFDHRWPFDIAVVPLYKGEPAGSQGKNAIETAKMLPPESVTWYIYCGITHCFSDGASGQALMADLLHFYAEETGEARPKTWVEAPEHLSLLQRRLYPSLCGRLPGQTADANNDIFHEIACEDFGKRRGYSSRLYFDPPIMNALSSAARDVLGCGLDVAWLTAIMGTMFRLFPEQRCIRLMLKVACRDGPGEVQMVGFLSEQRILTVDVLDPETASLLSIAGSIGAARRSRSWRAPAPFESGLCVYVNIVSAMVDGLPSGCRHVVRPANTPTNWSGIAYCHLNLRIDQISATNWDFRIFHWDASWGWSWLQVFAHALAQSIGNMATAPAAPLLQPLSLAPRQVASPSPAVESRKRGGTEAAEGGTTNGTADAEKLGQGPASKVQRTAAAADVAAGAARDEASQAAAA